MAELTPQEIAIALGKPQRQGKDWQCLCPAHDDHKPSLSITRKGGKTLVVCRAGCDQDAVISALRRRGLWHDVERDPKLRPAKRRIVASYNYRDPEGGLRYQVVRYDPKGFSQRRPNGSPDRFVNNMQGVHPLPYRLPELLADPAATVYINEGEKDCDNLGALGFVTTTNHGGAGKWSSEISHWFAGRNVVILPDNDEKGRAHAHDIAGKLAGIAATIRTVELPGLPPTGDVSNWIAIGGTAEDLERLVAIGGTEVVAPNPNQPLDVGNDPAPIPPRGWLLGNTFCRGFISGLIASGAAGKTPVRILQALSLATGRELSGEHVFLRGRVLFVSLEDGLDELRRRVRAAIVHHGIDPSEVRGRLFIWAPLGRKIAEMRNGSREVMTGDLEHDIRSFIRERQIDLVVIDPLLKAHTAEENDNTAVDAVAVILCRLAADLNCAIDVLHHERKGIAEPGHVDRARGASSFKDAGRLIYTVTPMSEDERKGFGLSEAERRSLIRIDSAKVNIAPPSIEARWFRIVGVPLGNGTELYPRGDEVPTVELWQPPDIWTDLPSAVISKILDDIEAGPAEGRRYSQANRAEDRSARQVIQKHRPGLTDEQCEVIVKTWLRTGMLGASDYKDPVLRKTRKGLFVLKRPG